MDDLFEKYTELTEIDRSRLSRMLMLSRAESGLSQEKVALEMDIAKKTVQNWERGISAPTLPQAIEWFRVMRVAALPYLLQFIFPDIEGISSDNTDEDLREQLIQLIAVLPPEGIRQLMYLFYGNHGSSPRGIMNMITAHLQTPMRFRYNHATQILSDYKLAADKKEIVKPNHVQPDIAYLEKAIDGGRDAILNNKDNYMV